MEKKMGNQNVKSIKETQIPNKVQEKREIKMLANNPFKQLNGYILSDIVAFLNLKQRLNIRLVSKQFSVTTNSFKTKAEISSLVMLPGNTNQNYIYLTLQLDCAQIQKLLFFSVNVETQDQGWASVNESSSWVQLRLFQLKELQNDQEETQQEITEVLNDQITSNFQQVKFKLVQKNYEIYQDNVIETINGLLKEDYNVNLCIVARSMYPGWECHIKSGNMQVVFDEYD